MTSIREMYDLLNRPSRTCTPRAPTARWSSTSRPARPDPCSRVSWPRTSTSTPPPPPTPSSAPTPATTTQRGEPTSEMNTPWPGWSVSSNFVLSQAILFKKKTSLSYFLSILFSQFSDKGGQLLETQILIKKFGGSWNQPRDLLVIS